MSEPAAPGGPLRITPEEVAQAVLPPPRTPGPGRAPDAPPRAPPVSHLAVASLALALLGVPLAGCVLGPVAIVCGALALSALHGREDRRGLGLALAGVGLGVLVFAGWTAGLWYALAQGPLAPASAARAVPPGDFGQRALGIQDAPPHIRRALVANVRLACAAGAQGASLGSGVHVASRDGRAYVLSNRHVADCAAGQALSLTFHDGERVEARVAWRAPEAVDLVVVEARPARDRAADAMRLGARAAARVGDPVFAVGNPLGYDATYTTGVLSAVRPLAAGGPAHGQVLQVQAAINPGNSGGGLYTAAGELLGVNTWATDKSVSEGLGFAIDVGTITALLRAGGPAVHGLVEPVTTAQEARP